MAALGVVSFHSGNSPHGKIHILQESANNIANNSNNMIKNHKREIVVLKKKPKIFPANQQTVSVSSLINNQNSVLVQNKGVNIAKPKKTMKLKDSVIAKVQNPPPIAVARRNARERNRVKQVNNGFATLRQHIPNEIAEIFESANNNRAANKKLSKVETLRMAVEYIRSLEILLDIEDNRDYKENNANISMSSFPSPASSESPQNGSAFEQSYFMQSPLLEDEEESNPPTPLPPVTNHHYSRIPGTNAFQLIPGPAPLHLYEDEENIHPLTPSSDLLSQEDMLMHPHLMDANMDFIQNNGQEFAVIQPSLLSSDFYSDSSLSPHGNVESLDMKYVTTLMNSDQQLLYPHSILISNSPDGSIHLHSENSRDRLQNNVVIIKDEQNKNAPIFIRNNENMAYSDDIDLKQEPDESDGGFIHERNGDMEEVLSWWNGQQRQEK